MVSNLSKLKIVYRDSRGKKREIYGNELDILGYTHIRPGQKGKCGTSIRVGRTYLPKGSEILDVSEERLEEPKLDI